MTSPKDPSQPVNAAGQADRKDAFGAEQTGSAPREFQPAPAAPATAALYRPATLAEALSVLLARLHDQMSPAERRELLEAISVLGQGEAAEAAAEERPETHGSWQERCAVLYQVIGCLADAAGVFETSDSVSDALDVACGRGDVEKLLPWPKDGDPVATLCKVRAETASSEGATTETDALCRRLQGDPPVSFTESDAEELAAHARQLEQKLGLWNWIKQSARTNADHAVIVTFIKEGHWSYLHGDPTKELEQQLRESRERERLANNAADGLRAMLADANERARLLQRDRDAFAEDCRQRDERIARLVAAASASAPFMECLGKVLRDVGFADRDIAEIRSRLTKALAQITSSSAREEHGKA